MKTIRLSIIMFLVTAGIFAQDAGSTITQNVSGSKDLTVLAANIKAAGLSQTLSGRGPFTVFAPKDPAFEKSSSISVEKTKSVDKSDLQDLMTYHVVAGKMDSKAIGAAIKTGNGKATLTTLQGGKLIATMEGSKLIITDQKGNRVTVIEADLNQSNGVVHIVDKVLLRK